MKESSCPDLHVTSLKSVRATLSGTGTGELRFACCLADVYALQGLNSMWAVQANCAEQQCIEHVSSYT